MPRFSDADDSESRLPQWVGTALAAVREGEPYPRWVTGAIKAAVVIGVLTAFADWASHRSAKADLARLVVETSRAKPDPVKTGSIRR